MTAIKVLRDQIIPDGMSVVAFMNRCIDVGEVGPLQAPPVKAGEVFEANILPNGNAYYWREQHGLPWMSYQGDYEIIKEGVLV